MILNGYLPNLEKLQVSFLSVSCFHDPILDIPPVEDSSSKKFRIPNILVDFRRGYLPNFSWILPSMRSISRNFEVRCLIYHSQLLGYFDCARNVTQLTLYSPVNFNVCSVLSQCRNLVYADFHSSKYSVFHHECGYRGLCSSNKLQYLSLYLQANNHEFILNFLKFNTFLGDSNPNSVFVIPKLSNNNIITKATYDWITSDASTFDSIKALNYLSKTWKKFSEPVLPEARESGFNRVIKFFRCGKF